MPEALASGGSRQSGRPSARTRIPPVSAPVPGAPSLALLVSNLPLLISTSDIGSLAPSVFYRSLITSAKTLSK